MATSVADPQQNLSSVKPAESTPRRVRPVGGPMNDGREETLETEQSLQSNQTPVVTEANAIPDVFNEWKDIQQPFSPQGSLSFKDSKPMEVSDITPQVKEKQVTQKEIRSFDSNLDFVRDMFMKPLEGVSNIAAGVVGEMPDALKDLGALIGPQKEERPKDQEEIKEENNEAFRTQNYIAALKRMPEHKVGAVEVGGQIMSTDEVIQKYGLSPGYEKGLFQEDSGELRVDVETAVERTQSELEKNAQGKKEDMLAQSLNHQPANLSNRLDAQEGQSQVSSSGAIVGAG